MTTTNNKDLAYYLGLPFRIEIEEEDGAYFARHPDLPGCAGDGETADEAIRDLKNAREIWTKARLDLGLDVPEPQTFSGRMSLRMSPDLHEALADSAAKSRVSLNQHLNEILARWVGGKTVESAVEKQVAALFAEAKANRAVTTSILGPVSGLSSQVIIGAHRLYGQYAVKSNVGVSSDETTGGADSMGQVVAFKPESKKATAL